jgi:hypothetical protein
VVLFALFALCSFPAPTGVGSGEEALQPVRITDTVTATAVRRSIRGAARRLREPECRRLLDEFVDAGGRRLTDTLSERGFAAPAYMGYMLFYDGTWNPACGRPQVVAVTLAPGSRIVHVCASRFRGVYAHNPSLAEAYLIHEMLHSLGLGENPPTPPAITSRVLEGCR